MKLYRAAQGIFVEENGTFFAVDTDDWDELISAPGLRAKVRESCNRAAVASLDTSDLLPPVGSQEVWAAGVTYYRSRSARIEESKDAGGGTFYDRVYSADRPEIFFKATGRRVIGPGGAVRIRSDAKWSVPRTGADARDQRSWRNYRIYHRERYELAGHRRIEPARPASSQTLRRKLRAWSLYLVVGETNTQNYRDRHSDRTERDDRIFRDDDAG